MNKENIDWSKAPVGATHYCHNSLYHWHKWDGRSLYFFIPGHSGDPDPVWVLLECDFESCENIINKSVARPSMTASSDWDGEGYPPPNTVCEFAYRGSLYTGRKAHIIAYHDDLVFCHLDGNEQANIYRVTELKFRPCRLNVVYESLVLAAQAFSHGEYSTRGQTAIAEHAFIAGADWQKEQGR